jgi:rhodanese-related sulfurtransferase
MQNLSQQQWQEQLTQADNAVIIDVRTQNEIEMGYIPNALHINIMDAGNFMRQVEQLDKTKDYFVYCKAGGRSAQACMIMNSLGFQNTFNLEGGFDQWNGEKTF